jgi:hypothetical protein
MNYRRMSSKEVNKWIKKRSQLDAIKRQQVKDQDTSPPIPFYTVGKKRRTATGKLCDTIHQNGREIQDKYCRHVVYPDLQIASRESVFNPHPRLQERTLKSFKQYLNECYP